MYRCILAEPILFAIVATISCSVAILKDRTSDAISYPTTEATFEPTTEALEIQVIPPEDELGMPDFHITTVENVQSSSREELISLRHFFIGGMIFLILGVALGALITFIVMSIRMKKKRFCSSCGCDRYDWFRRYSGMQSPPPKNVKPKNVSVKEEEQSPVIELEDKPERPRLRKVQADVEVHVPQRATEVGYKVQSDSVDAAQTTKDENGELNNETDREQGPSSENAETSVQRAEDLQLTLENSRTPNRSRSKIPISGEFLRRHQMRNLEPVQEEVLPLNPQSPTSQGNTEENLSRSNSVRSTEL